MKKPVETCVMVLLMCLVLVSSVCVATVEVSQEWKMTMDPVTAITCVAYFIPDVPNVPDSLIFSLPPSWTNWVPFDYISEGWDTALTDGGKTAYIFGPQIINLGPGYLDIFSYLLYYQWEEEDVIDYPVYLDIVVFNGDDVVYDSFRYGTPGSGTPFQWEEDNVDGPYENPVPEPMTVCILTIGAAFLRKRWR